MFLGFIVTVVKEKQRKWARPWTHWLQSINPEDIQRHQLHVWGPFRSVGHRFYHDITTNNGRSDYLLIGSSSGFGYLLDVCSFITYKWLSTNTDTKIHPKKLRIVYMNRNHEIISWLQQEISYLIDHLGRTGGSSITIEATLYHTGDVPRDAKKEFNKMTESSTQETNKQGNSIGIMQKKMHQMIHRTLSDPLSNGNLTVHKESHRRLRIEEYFPANNKEERQVTTTSSDCVQLLTGRPNLDKILSEMSPRDSEVFFIGNPVIGKTIEEACSKYDLYYIGDFTSGSEAIQSDNKVFRKYFVTTLKVVLVTIVVCGYLHLRLFIDHFTK